MPTLYVTANAGRSFSSGGSTYLVPKNTIGAVVDANGSTTTVDAQWGLVAKDTSGTFTLATDITEASVPLSEVAAPVDFFSIWS